MDVKGTFFNGEGNGDFRASLKKFTDQFGMDLSDVRDMTVSALLAKMLVTSNDEATTAGLQQLQNYLKSAGLLDKKVGAVGLGSMTTEEKS
jgi:flotillin